MGEDSRLDVNPDVGRHDLPRKRARGEPSADGGLLCRGAPVDRVGGGCGSRPDGGRAEQQRDAKAAAHRVSLGCGTDAAAASAYGLTVNRLRSKVITRSRESETSGGLPILREANRPVSSDD